MKFPFPLLILDTETTGFVPKIHRVMEFACIKTNQSGSTDPRDQEIFETLLSIPPDFEIPSAIQILTQIKPEDLIGKPTFQDVLPTLQAMLTPETVIVGQNVQFDLKMLRGEGWDLIDHPWIDTSMLASIVYPELESYSLGYMSTVLGLNHTPKHRALGDVRATAELLGKCVERLEMLPEDDLKILQDIAERGPESYRRLFAALQSSKKKTRPEWLEGARVRHRRGADKQSIGLDPAGDEDVRLIAEPLDPQFVPSLIASAKGNTWIAVKNIEAILRRVEIPETVTVLHPPELLLSKTALKKFLAQETFTADEMTLLMKIALYEPRVRSDIPVHGEEYQIWTGKVAASADSPEMTELLARAKDGVSLLSHQHLLTMSREPEFSIPEDTALFVDDASMLEDTATNALGWACSVPPIRAAATGDILLTQCVDIIELWAEQARAGLDLKYLTVTDLESKSTTELKSTLTDVLAGGVPAAIRSPLEQLLLILDPENLSGRITWIESFADSSKHIKSVPEDVAALLKDLLYSRFKTTLFVPPGDEHDFRSILPLQSKAIFGQLSASKPDISLKMPVGVMLGQALEPKGKTILLVSSKRTIEDVYVRHGPRLEALGATMICQGYGGGLGRMQAEFAAASSPAFLVLTPWMYEGINLPPESVDRLILQTLPFDHPSHAVVSRRGARYQDGFNDYTIPRLKHRLFRLVRNFLRHSVKGAAIEVLDDRLRTKEYGKRVAKYLEGLIGAQIVHQSGAAAPRATKINVQEKGSTKPRATDIVPQKKKATRKDDGQMKLL
jgi:DNA polymerase III epsilon subunit-like protein